MILELEVMKIMNTYFREMLSIESDDENRIHKEQLIIEKMRQYMRKAVEENLAIALTSPDKIIRKVAAEICKEKKNEEH